MRNYTLAEIKPSLTKIIFLVIFLFVFCSIQLLAQENISVIRNSKGAPETMDAKELKNVLKGEKQRWKDGTKIVIALMKTNTPIGQTSAKKIYNMTGDELNRYWLALVFQGKVSAPSFFNSLSELETFVAQTPGAIGVVKLAPSNESQVIVIDGKKEF